MTRLLLAWGIAADRIGERLVIVHRARRRRPPRSRRATTVDGFTALVVALAADGRLRRLGQLGESAARSCTGSSATSAGLALGIRQAAIPIGGFAGAIALPAIVAAAGVRRGLRRARGQLYRLGAPRRGRAARAAAATKGPRRALRQPAARRAHVAPLLGKRVVLAGQLAIMAFVVLFLHDARGFVDRAGGGRARRGPGRSARPCAPRRPPLRPGTPPHPAVPAAQSRRSRFARRVGGADLRRSSLLVPMLVVAGSWG